MAKTKTTILNEEMINNIFTDEWYCDVVNAARFAVLNLKNSPLSEEDLVRYIIDYNIVTRLESGLLENLIDLLPESINWTKTPVIDAFDQFKEIIDSCTVCPRFSKYSVKIKVSKKSLVWKEFLSWTDIVNATDPIVQATIEDTDVKNVVVFTVTLKD